jgi:DNA mismatch endonuclease, patch repair protein
VTDVFTREKRSEVMSRVRSRGNRSTELALASVFRKMKVNGWRRHLPMAGRPDFCFPDMQVVVFVDGCFWHGCPWHGTMPATNRPFWKAKIERNKRRDLSVKRLLRREGWKVVRLWEHDLKAGGGLPATLKRALAR